MRAVRTATVMAGLVAVLVTALTAATGAVQDKDCPDFTSQAEAQAAFDAAGPGDPLGLDRDGDGVACELREDTVAGAPIATSFAEGLYQVGHTIRVGQYRTPGTTTDCYWARLSADTGATTAIIANGLGRGPRSVTVLATDAFVEFRGACVWTLDGATPTVPGAGTTTTTAAATTTTTAAASTTTTAAATLPPATTTPQVSVVPVGGVATGGRPGS